MPQDALGKCPHDVADPGDGRPRPQILSDAAEAPHVAEQDRDVGILPVEQIRVTSQLFRQLAAEELLKTHPLLRGGPFLGEAFQPDGDAEGQRLHELSLQLADARLGRRPRHDGGDRRRGRR